MGKPKRFIFIANDTEQVSLKLPRVRRVNVS